MFDDTPSQGAGSVPPNLPMGEPEDIFSSVGEPQSADVPDGIPQGGSGSIPPEVQTQTALSAGVLKPKQDTAPLTGVDTMAPIPPQQQPVSAAPTSRPEATPPSPSSAPAQPPSQFTSPPAPTTHTMPADTPEIYSLKEPKISKGIITVLVIVIVLAVFGIGGLFIYNQFIRGNGQAAVPSVAGTDTALDTDPFDSVDTVSSTVDTEVPVASPDDDIIFGEPNDTDADGLDDAREKSINTDPAHWDTDGDELSDGDEVIIWKTDPLNPDTDGDSYPDGQEVKSGYSPTGPGKIFEPEETSSTTAQ